MKRQAATLSDDTTSNDQQLVHSNKKKKLSDQVTLILDQTISSEFLKLKIRDVPSAMKYDSIVVPVLCQSFKYFDFDIVKHGRFLIDSLFQEFKTQDIDEFFQHNKIAAQAITWLNQWNNQTIVSMIIEKDAYVALEHSSEALRRIFGNQREIILRAIEQKGNALRFASKELQNDIHVVKKAVAQDGMALQFASLFMRNTYDVVIVAVRQNGLALQFVI